MPCWKSALIVMIYISTCCICTVYTAMHTNSYIQVLSVLELLFVLNLFKTRNFMFNHWSADILTRIPFFESFAGSHVNTSSHICHSHEWLWQMWDDVYTRNCFSESEGTRFGAPGQKGTAVNEWVHSFVDFCLIRWRSSHKFAKMDLYPLSLMSLRNAVCSTGCRPIIGRCFGACNGTSCAEERRPQ